MKQYVIDELRPADLEKVEAYLNEHFGFSGVGGVYWVPLETEMLTDTQMSHTECQPFYFAIEIDKDRMACEFLIRTRNRVRCSCINYATETQRNWLIQFADAIFDNLDILT
jgi:hypothetical protein